MENWFSRINSILSQPKWRPEKYGRGPGGFYDPNSYIGNVHYLVTGLLVIFFGRYGDLFIYYWHLIFGVEYSIPSPGKIQWYGRVSFFLRVWMCLLAILFMRDFHRRRKMMLHLYPYEKENNGAGNLFQNSPLFRDLVFGWPLLMALPLVFFAYPVDALLGISFGGIAYMINYKIYKRKSLILSVSAVLSFSIGSLAILSWWKMSIAVNGFPDGWQEIPMLPLF